MAKKWVWASGVSLVTVAATLMALWNPVAFTGLVVASLGLIVLVKVQDWWRRAFLLAILTLYAASSSVDALSSLGALAKIGGVALLVAATVLTTQGAQPHPNRIHTALLRTLTVIVALAGVSLVWSQARLETLLDGATMLALVFIMHRVSTSRWRDGQVMAGDLATGYWTSVTFLAAGGVATFAGVAGTIRLGGRHQWLLNNPNILGIMGAVTLTLGVGLALHYKSPFLWVSLLVPAAAVLMSQSRTAMVAVAVAVAWVAIRRGLSSTLLVGGAAVVGFALLQGARVFDRFESGGDPLSLRTLVWGEAWRTLIANPLGVGWAATPSALEHLYLRGATQSGFYSAHNSYLQFVLELGWISVVPLAVLMVVLVVILLRSSVDGLGAGLVATVMVGVLVQFTESLMFGVGQPYPWMLWLAVGAAAVNISPARATKKARNTGKFYAVEPGTSKIRAVR